MGLQNNDVTGDVLVIAGTIFPPTGETERFRIDSPSVFEVTPANNADDIRSVIPDSGADMVVTAYQTDPGHALMLALYLRQQSGESLAGGQAGLARFGGQAGADACRWENTTILKPSSIVSSRTKTPITWTIRLSGVQRGV
jgi:hypothetical protein